MCQFNLEWRYFTWYLYRYRFLYIYLYIYFFFFIYFTITIHDIIELGHGNSIIGTSNQVFYNGTKPFNPHLRWIHDTYFDINEEGGKRPVDLFIFASMLLVPHLFVLWMNGRISVLKQYESTSTVERKGEHKCMVDDLIKILCMDINNGRLCVKQERFGYST